MMGIRGLVARRLLARPNTRSVTHQLRRRRFERFLREVGVKPEDRILDVGGYPYFWHGSGLERNVTILNVQLPPTRERPFTWILGDACRMRMFPDKAFDVVFSNSVIEHVGDVERQAAMAGEVRRVARRYWVQTPYKHFPIEAHFVFPCFQYLPGPFREVVARAWPFSYAKMLGLDPMQEARHIWLLDRRRMRALFPDADLLVERFAGLTKSLIAVQR